MIFGGFGYYCHYSALDSIRTPIGWVLSEGEEDVAITHHYCRDHISLNLKGTDCKRHDSQLYGHNMPLSLKGSLVKNGYKD